MAPKAAAAPKWCWESDDGFLPYKPKDAQTIEKAYQAAGCTGAAKVNFNGSDYHMDFVAMTQKNLESGKVRRVQRPADLTATPSSSQLTPSLPAVVVSTPPLQAPSVPVLPVSTPAVVPPPTVAVVPPPTVPVPTPPPQAPTEQQQPDAQVGLAAPPASVSVLPAAAPTSITGSGVTWYYTDDFGTEHPFDVRTSAELEVRFLAAAAGDVTPRELKIIGCDYEVDIGYMIITNCWSGDTSCIARRRTPPSPGDKALLLAIEAHVAAAPPAPKRPKRGRQVTYAELCAPPNKKAQAEGSSAAGGGLKAASPVNDLLEVDPHSGKAFNHHVFRVSDSNIPYTIRLKQATKFFVAQLLESNDKDTWVVFTRWGKLGAVGQSKADTFTAQNKATSAFASKFREKTKNDWSLYYADQSSFTPVPGKYELATQAEISGGGGWFSVDDDDSE